MEINKKWCVCGRHKIYLEEDMCAACEAEEREQEGLERTAEALRKALNKKVEA